MGHHSVAIANDIGACIYVVPLQLLKTSTTVGTPVKISSTAIYFRKATILAKKSLAGTNNTGNMLLGLGSTTITLPYSLAPGDEVILEAPVGAKWSLSDWYIDPATTSGDGVVVIYS